MNRIVLASFGILCLLSTVFLMGMTFNAQKVKAQEYIYIRADGSVDPPEANITSSDSVTYNFTGNNFGHLTIERGNIVVDGLGYTLEGTGYVDGISFRDIFNVTVKNLEITGFENGVDVYNSSNNKFYGNNITNNNNHAFYFSDSSNSTLSENWIANNGGYSYHGYSAIKISYSSNITIYHNNITQNTYLEGIELWSSANNTIFENNIVNNYFGIRFFSSNNNHFYGNNVTSCLRSGIGISSSSNNTLYNNQLSGNKYGFDVSGYELSHYLNNINTSNLVDGKPVYYLINRHGLIVTASTHPDIGWLALINSTNIKVVGLNLTENGQGLLLAYTNSSRIANNVITNNYNGLEFFASVNNTIYQNNIVNNEYQGIYFWEYSNGNKIFENNISDNDYLGLYLSDSSNNTYQIESYDLMNSWDNGVEGNYWSDYNRTDTDQDGIGNILYIIDENNNDSHPLMGLFSSFNTSLDKFVNVVSNSTMEDFQYFKDNSTMEMFVSNMTSNQTCGFCRVTIPHALMNVTNIEVIIDNDTTPLLYHNYTLYDNGTHRWIYFSYPHSTHEIDIIPEFPSLLILLPFLIVTLLAAITLRRKYPLHSTNS